MRPRSKTMDRSASWNRWTNFPAGGSAGKVEVRSPDVGMAAADSRAGTSRAGTAKVAAGSGVAPALQTVLQKAAETRMEARLVAQTTAAVAPASPARPSDRMPDHPCHSSLIPPHESNRHGAFLSNWPDYASHYDTGSEHHGLFRTSSGHA